MPPALGPQLSPAMPLVEVLEQDTEYQGYVRVDVYSIRTRNFNGDWSEPYRRDIVATGESGHATAALLYEPESDSVLLIEQFRMVNFLNTPERAWQLELVAGLIGIGEEPDNTIRREIIEEAGCETSQIEKICIFTPSPGVYSERVHLYLARLPQGIEAGVHGLASEGENIRGHKMSFAQALELSDSGFIEDLKTMYALNWLARRHAAIRQRWLNSKET